jgi:hypothetical protein
VLREVAQLSPLRQIARVPALITVQRTVSLVFGDISDAPFGFEKYYGVLERRQQTVKDPHDSVNMLVMCIESAQRSVVKDGVWPGLQYSHVRP